MPRWWLPSISSDFSTLQPRIRNATGGGRRCVYAEVTKLLAIGWSKGGESKGSHGWLGLGNLQADRRAVGGGDGAGASGARSRGLRASGWRSSASRN